MHIITKKELRDRILLLLRNQDNETRLTKSKEIQRKLFKAKEFNEAKRILFYASFGGEVETMEMIKESLKLNKTVGLPRITAGSNAFVPVKVTSLANDLETGPFGIQQPKDAGLEPMDVRELDMVVVPGVAFDKDNNRLGRGGGYYDRFLAQLFSRTVTVGLAFDFQIVDSLPQTENHDVPVTRIFSA